MHRRRPLSPVERGLAVGLALIWLVGGSFALYLALVHSLWSTGCCALAAIVYSLAWLRVAALSRLLTWRDLIAPWRRL